MKLFVYKALFILLLSGCAQTQVPYKVVKALEHKSNLLPIQFPIGITQEKLGEKKYRITAKLAELGTPERARSMALYHASILAESKGFNAFLVDRRGDSSWCGSSRNSKTKAIGTISGGPAAKLLITLIDAEKSDKRKKLYFVEKTKNSNKLLMDKVPTEIELEQISDERYKHCLKRAQKRRVIR
jgi:hypothetical protein